MQNKKLINDKRFVIGITMGDPAGIGPEIIVSALEESESYIHDICKPLILGDARIMEQAVKLKKSSLKVHEIDTPDSALFTHGSMDLINLSNLSFSRLKPKTPTPETGRAMLNYITTAVDLAMSRQIAAMVTAPITKTAFKMANSPFHGHTELIANKTGTDNYAMMLAGEKLRVILVTIHMPLSEVPERLTIDNIIKTIAIAGTSLQKKFGIKTPRIAVAGLNPHAGEDNMFGSEEARIIIPAVNQAKQNARASKQEVHIEGPFPPDTVFYHAAQGKYDCVVCMYHDQGLIPFKLLHFSDGVNTTLGLPIIRTSVDHGTAYDIAWKNRADHRSLVEAIKMAVLQASQVNQMRINEKNHRKEV